MRRDLLITALIFFAVGFLAGYIYLKQAGGGERRAALPQPRTTGETELALPEGHPPLDISQRWRSLEQQAQANPRDPRAAVELANFLFSLERWEDALVWYRRALELAPKNADARTDLGSCYYNLDRFDEAITEFTRALEIEPNKPEALFNLAMARLRGKQDRAGARRAYEQLRRHHPDFPGVELLGQELDNGNRPR
ncbi:MAG: tetratricopeptide repeat protein [Terriglobia bacterium]